ncbi:hypothetical protein F5H01DRAFT_384123 [Linnemannia elongata]|nr:hypothetical protein F5H01DRAFT_384123 [Linnemannia elongata]
MTNGKEAPTTFSSHYIIRLVVEIPLNPGDLSRLLLSFSPDLRNGTSTRRIEFQFANATSKFFGGPRLPNREDDLSDVESTIVDHEAPIVLLPTIQDHHDAVQVQLDAAQALTRVLVIAAAMIAVAALIVVAAL